MNYLNKEYTIMSNKQLKGFEETDKNKDFINFEVECKINALEFYRTIEYLYKINTSRVELSIEPKHLILSMNEFVEAEVKIPLIYPIEELGVNLNLGRISSGYSVEYLYKILKTYSVKELKEEFILLEFGEDMPVNIKFKDDWVLLAPRLQQS